MHPMSDSTESGSANHDAAQAEPWYARGLRFECTGCGHCCTGVDGYVWVTVEEIRAMAARRGLGLDDFGRRFLRLVDGHYALVNAPDGSSCVFLEGKQCTVYEDRPAQCRAFPWWPANLRSSGTWSRAAMYCEGISPDAPLVELSTIQEQLAVAVAVGLDDDD